MTASQQKVATYTGDKQWDRKARKTTTVSVHWVADTPTQQSPVDLRMDCSNYCRGTYGIKKQGGLRLDGWGVQGDVMGKSWDNLTP